jgi:hypothetical protein
MAKAPTKIQKLLFRALPPYEFVEEILHHCGFVNGFNDRRLVTKVGLSPGLGRLDEWLPFLEPYYLPCKARRFFGPEKGFDVYKLVTVLRHILRVHGYDLVSQEVADHGAKYTLYQIRPATTLEDCEAAALDPGLEVTFT